MVRSTVPVAVLAVLAAGVACAADGNRPKYRPVVAGDLAVNPYDIISVYRPLDERSAVVLIGRPGQEVQAVVIRDGRDAATLFDELWNNKEVTKDPGDDDGKPLTRMKLKEAEDKRGTLIANVDRILAIVRKDSRRRIRIYLDAPEPAESEDADWSGPFEISNDRDEGDIILAAYKVCLYGR